MLLLIAEGLGRAIRAPIRSAMLSHAASRTGAGWAFGLHTALDQTGGMSGSLLALLLMLGAGYQHGFASLIVPALISLALLMAAAGSTLVRASSNCFDQNAERLGVDHDAAQLGAQHPGGALGGEVELVLQL